MPSQDRIPDRLGPYRLRERIGEGGMGAVFLARDRERRPVAVKVLHSRVADEATARRRLAREVEAMRRVRSPYVAEVLDADVTGKLPYIVTRYVPGYTLDHLVRQQGPLAPRSLEKLARGLAEALVAVHAAGVVHRDLKPGNVMISDGRPIVIDFGIAHTGDSTRLTQTGMFMGTPGYLAPEVIEGQPSSEASDIHSWGATVAFAATGRAPFGSGSFETIFFRIVQGKADIDGVPAPLSQLVAAALSRDPRQRPTAAWLQAQCSSLDLSAAALGNGMAARTAGAANGAAAAGAAGAAGVAAAGAAAAGAVGYGAAQAAGYGRAAAGGANGVSGAAGANGARLVAGQRGASGLLQGAPQRHANGQSEPIRPDQFADMLPPVQYASAARGGAPARMRPAPAGAGPYGSAPPSGYPPGGAAGSAAWGGADAARGADAYQRVRPRPLLGLAALVLAVAVSVMLPVAGTIAALGVITLLRAADRAQSALTVRRSVRGPSASDIVVSVITAPWTIARSLLTMVLLAPAALAIAAVVAVATLITVRTNASALAGSYAAGAAVAFYATGPGSGGPRRQLNRLYCAVGRGRESSTVLAIVMLCLAGAAVAAATSQPPLYWPMINWMLPHLPNLSNMLHLPHLNLPHLGAGRGGPGFTGYRGYGG